jgi:hypothetical protein
MARLRNRIRKADYFSDGELLRWHRDKRQTYSGLWAMAEDSGCLEDDCFEWKMAIWPSPLDADITVELLEQWRDELIEAGKLIPYEAEGKRYLFLRNFHQHEHPPNPQKPDLPLPPWVTAEVSEGRAKDGKKWSRCVLTVTPEDIPPRNGIRADSGQTQGRGKTTAARGPQSCPVQSGPDQYLNTLADADAPAGADDDGFEEWWGTYGKVGSKADAEALYRFWRGKGAERDDLLTAARAYRTHCERTDCKIAHARTFLAKPPKGGRARWYEWAVGEEHGTMDPADDSRLNDVLTAGAQAFGLTGGDHARGSGETGKRATGGRPTRALAGGEDDRRRVPAGQLDP